MERCVGAISPCVVMTLRPILALSPGAGQAPLVCVGWWALSSAGVKSRGPTKQVRAILAFRKRHFVASNTGRFILTFIVSIDIITRCYCGVQSCPRASLPPSRSRAHPSCKGAGQNSGVRIRGTERAEGSRPEGSRQGAIGGEMTVDGRQWTVNGGNRGYQVSGVRRRGK